MPKGNSVLANAKRAKKDEFYTQLEDIEQELQHYWEHFHGKTVLLNCDDPFESNFFFYFANYFNILELKKLIAVSYKGSPVAGTDGFYANLIDQVYGVEDTPESHPYKAVMTCLRDTDGDTGINKKDIKELFEMGENTLTRLKGDGDFRSEECIELLKEADIVVTNPPFSLFREYVAQLIEYDKKFLIIGNQNAITYKEIFPLLKENKMWLGYRFNRRVAGKNMTFRVPDNYPLSGTETRVGDDGHKYVSVAGTGWFTNLDHKKRHEEMLLVERYYGKLGTPEKYPKYDNYDAIEVSKVADIPKDYDGVMGVPITFMDKYNPDQFEILGITDRQNTSGLRTKKYTADDSPKYNDLNARSVLCVNGEYKQMYARVLIRNLHPATKE